MDPGEIRIALETAAGPLEDVLRAARDNAAALAPAVIAVADRMADGVLPLPHEKRLLCGGLFPLAAARETSVCPSFLRLLASPPPELEWLLGEDRGDAIGQLLLSVYDGDDAAVCALLEKPGLDEDVRCAVFPVMARLVWEGRASREAFLATLDRFDREQMAETDSLAWIGWQDAIQLLGLTGWIERVRSAWQAGRVSKALFRDIDRDDWIERTMAAAAAPDDDRRFAEAFVVPIDDPADLPWEMDPSSGPDEAPTAEERAWLNIALLRRSDSGVMVLERADGFLAGIAAGPVRMPPEEYLPHIWAQQDPAEVFDTPAHAELAGMLLEKRQAQLEQALDAGKPIDLWIVHELGSFAGALWAAGFFDAIQAREDEWQPLLRKRRMKDELLTPLLMLMPDLESDEPTELPASERRQLLDLLPAIVTGVRTFWDSSGPPPQVRAVPKVGRNDPCPCGSGKKFKKCCGAFA